MRRVGGGLAGSSTLATASSAVVSGAAGKYVGDTLYEMGSEVKESIEEVF
ncbi:hypothetical protein [Vibrio bivalvicida]|nr:hypothetical protein [Vibrio bivalvicida]